ncbi:hypothetical protein KKH23_09375 [Patescibacteria group bacterium]|nr:hypothetical protein [Patescibacteria group bacterium]
MPIQMGPPLPRSMEVYWPWYKPPAPPEVTYACPYCPAEFATEAELLSHIREAHVGQPPQVIYVCPYCGARFSTASEVADHIAEAHPVTPKIPTPPEIPTPPVPPVAAADIRAQNLTIQPSQVNVGERVTIGITAKNYGTATGSKVITCDVNGKMSSQTVAMDPNQSRNITFEATPKEAKTYSVSVNGLSGSFRAVEVAYISDISYQNPPSREGEKINMVLSASLPEGYAYRAWFASTELKAPKMLTIVGNQYVGGLPFYFSRGVLHAAIDGKDCVNPLPHPDFPEDPSLGYPPRSMTGKFQIEVYSAWPDYDAIKELVYQTAVPATLYS